jgi:L-ascorbate metabolism protein UlaG (beta-lactamase superfamily)
MSSSRLQVTYIGGPTALLELGGLRLLTDPTFDPAGSEYRAPGGWAHFSETRAEIDRAFAAAGLADRLRWPIAGQAMELSAT